MVYKSMEEVLTVQGYKLIDDAWDKFGRRTYQHNDDATRVHIKSLGMMLSGLGWNASSDTLRAFCNRETGELIEVEPGGSETTGHFLHHMKEVP